MSDEDLKRQADSDWIDHADSPYERYLELKLARAKKERDDLLAACQRAKTALKLVPALLHRQLPARLSILIYKRQLMI